MSPFIFAAFQGDVAAIQRMLAKGLDPNTRDDTGNIAIVAAASGGICLPSIYYFKVEQTLTKSL